MRRTLGVLGASITGLVVVFVIDLATPRDVVVDSLYVLPILLAAAVLTRRAAVAVWLLAVILQLVPLLGLRANLLTECAEVVALTSAFLIVLFLRAAGSRKDASSPRVSAEPAATSSIRSDLHGVAAALTPREREVADLAAAGRSAKDIAQELSIGRRTVETHLAHAYAKLGVKSKVALILKRERLLGAVKEKGGPGAAGRSAS